MKDLFKLILGVLASLFKSRAKLEVEILILRQQINVLRRRAPRWVSGVLALAVAQPFWQTGDLG